MQGHSTFAIPLRTRDLRAVQASTNFDLDALGTNAHRICHGPLHRASEHHAPFKLLRNTFRNQLSVKFRLPDLADVDAHVLKLHVYHSGDFGTQLFDVLAFLTNHDTRACRKDRDIDLLRLAFDCDTTDGCIFELVFYMNA